MFIDRLFFYIVRVGIDCPSVVCWCPDPSVVLLVRVDKLDAVDLSRIDLTRSTPTRLLALLGSEIYYSVSNGSEAERREAKEKGKKKTGKTTKERMKE